MRAPPLARMAAVAAPRPEAEPVTIAHKPSFDIRISSCCCELFLNGPLVGLAYHIAWQGPCKSDKFRSTEFVLCLMSIMPPSQAALRRALVRAMAFAHHKAQEKIEKRPHREIDGTGEKPARMVPINMRNAVAESENIVAET